MHVLLSSTLELSDHYSNCLNFILCENYVFKDEYLELGVLAHVSNPNSHKIED